ncbi:MAG TPA: hypothetical protein VII66_07805 [Gemmatimonadaceae bacterium]
MSRITSIKLAIGTAGFVTWAYGARVDNARVRLAGMIVIAAALVLRFLPASVRRRIDG